MMDRLGITRKLTNKGGASRDSSGSPQTASLPAGAPLTDTERNQVIEQVKSGVIARLGAGVDTAVVDQIVRRVVEKL
jgi:hypothetical protein